MPPEAMNQAIAEWCGWRSFSGGPYFAVDPQTGVPTCAPDYLNDLNAMHEAERRLTDAEHRIFRFHLGAITTLDQRLVVSCTAAQRAEALLRTIGKWED